MKNKFNLLRILCLLLILLILIISVSYSLIPQIKLNGKTNIVLNVNQNYKEKGATAKNIFGKNNYKININGKVNTKKIGKYKLEYIIKQKYIISKATRIVEIKDQIPPEITLNDGDSINVCPNKEYEEIGYSAIDNYDGDITNKVNIVKNKDFIKYKVEDSSKNVSIKERKLIYEDKTPPTLELKGNSTELVEKNSTYKEPGYTAIDNCDGDITNNVQVDGNVDTSINGTYELTYTITDSSDNITTQKRKVKVYNRQYNYVPYSGGAVIYLTFDDGPSASVTGKILDILNEENIKATFFVINHSDSLNYLIKREYDEGHTVGLHSFTHRYDTVYSSIDEYFSDLYLISDKVKNITGQESKIMRFPGGSSNTISRNYSKGIMSNLVNEVSNRGFVYFDWNVGSGDAGGAYTSDAVYNNVIKGLSKSKPNIVLMHDYENNYKTLNALRNIIRYGKENGYTFDRITTSTFQAKQRVNN